MMQKFTLFLLASSAAAYCEDSYPDPDSGGSWCGDGAIHDGMNCWGSCLTGCSWTSDTCTQQTCGRTTGDSCVFTTAPLCSWHCPNKLPATYESVKNKTAAVKGMAKTVARVEGEAKLIKSVEKPIDETRNTCLDGGAACGGLDCCFTFGNTDCCCPSGSHCAVHSGTSCGTVCAPGFMELVQQS